MLPERAQRRAAQHRAAAARVLPGRHAERVRRLEPGGQGRRGHLDVGSPGFLHGARRCPTGRPAPRSASRRSCRRGSATARSSSRTTRTATSMIDPTSSKTTIEVVNLLLGKGNDRVTITSTMVPGPDRPEANSGSGIDTDALPAAGRRRPEQHAVGARRHHDRPRRRQPRARDQGRLRDLRQPGARGSTTPRGARPASPSGSSCGSAPRRRRSRSPAFAGGTTDARPRRGPGRRRARVTGTTVSVIDPKTNVARIGGDTLVVTGGREHDRRRRPDVAARALRRHLAGRRVVLEQHDAPGGAAVRRPAAAAAEPADTAATRSRSTRSARPTTSSTSRPPSRSPSSATT